MNVYEKAMRLDKKRLELMDRPEINDHPILSLLKPQQRVNLLVEIGAKFLIKYEKAQGIKIEKDSGLVTPPNIYGERRIQFLEDGTLLLDLLGLEKELVT